MSKSIVKNRRNKQNNKRMSWISEKIVVKGLLSKECIAQHTELLMFDISKPLSHLIRESI